jgi:hypothetical protein
MYEKIDETLIVSPLTTHHVLQRCARDGQHGDQGGG